jgi:hypothetical protein
VSGCSNNRASQDCEEIKRQAAGQWNQILKATCGLTDEQLNPKIHQPCPKCGGTDRFRAFDDVNETGGLLCNQCHNKNNRDGFASIQWLLGCTFREALLMVFVFLGGRSSHNQKSSKTRPAETQKPKKLHHTSELAAGAIAYGMHKDGTLPSKRTPDARWPYHYANGSVAGEVLRWNSPDGSKLIRQTSRVDGGWLTSAMPELRPVYRLPEIIDADEVWICEGEKAADAAVSLGLEATTSAGGSNAAAKSDWSTLDGKRVLILPDNDDSGRKFVQSVLHLMRQQAPNATVEVKQLKDDWPEIPDSGDVYDWSEHFDSSDGETLRTRLYALPDRKGDFDSSNDQRESVKVRERSFAGKSASELWALASQPVQWLVQDVFSCDQPTIFGAKQKSLKTTLLTDLAVSLASGLSWLNRFEIPLQRRVLFVTGESSESAAMRKIQRAAAARNLRCEDITDFLRIEAITFPSLPSLEDCMAIQEAVQKYKIEVVLVDPLYMGLQGVNTSNLNEVGPAMRQFMAHCKPANLIIAHHVKKTASYDDAPNLEDLSQAGIAEFAGNYWLMGRMGEYTGEGLHTLAIRYGGRDEQFGLLKLEFDERNWTSHFSSLLDDRHHRKARRETEQVNTLTQRVLDELKRYKDGTSESALADAVGTQRKRPLFQTTLLELEARGAILCIPEFKPTKSKATKGWKLTFDK